LAKKQHNRPQSQKFIEAARAAGCDESEEAFDKTLRALITVKPMTNAQVKNKAKRQKKE